MAIVKTTTFTGPVVVGLNDKKGQLRLTDGKNINTQKYISLAAPDTVTANTTLTFPDGAGLSNQVLTTDGNGALTWTTKTSGSFALVDDTTPELGGDLASNGHNIDMADNDKIQVGTGNDLQIYHDPSAPGGSTNFIVGDSGVYTFIQADNLRLRNKDGSKNYINMVSGAATTLYYDNNPKLETTATGVQSTGTVNVNGAYTLPTSDGTPNQVLQTDGAGAVTFATVSASPGGATTQIQYNNAGAFAGSADFTIGANQIKLNGDYPIGTENVALGEGALSNVTVNGRYAVAIGHNAMSAAMDVQNNTAVGSDSLKIVTSGANNTALGQGTLTFNVSGDQNVAIGSSALYVNTGSNNVAVGSGALGNGASHTNNTAVGQSAGSSASAGCTNITCLGYNAEPSTTSATNEITLGDSSVATLRCQVTSITALSDARDKKNIEDLKVGLDFIDDLKPVTFEWDTRDGAKKDIKDVGFIAQDLDEVQQKHGIEDNLQLVLKANPDKLEASQGKLIPILVQAIKDLKKEIDQLKNA